MLDDKSSSEVMIELKRLNIMSAREMNIINKYLKDELDEFPFWK